MDLNLGRGVNFGGWLSQAPDSNEHRQTFITKDDFGRVRDWGFDNVRLPFDYPLICSEEDMSTLQEPGLEWIDRGLEWAESAGLKVILGMHKLPGYTFMDLVNEPDAAPPLFTDPAKQSFFFALWEMLAKRYLGRFPDVVFELANEIAAPTEQEWNALAAAGTAAIRKVDPTRPVVVGSNCWNVCATYKDLAAIDDPNIIYNFHFYNPFPFTHQKASWSPEMVYYDTTVHYPGNSPGMRETAKKAKHEGKTHVAEALDGLSSFFEDRVSDKDHLEVLMEPSFAFAREHHVPLYCGEFGVIDMAPKEDAIRWYRDTIQVFAEHHVSWSMWSYKGMDFGIVDHDGKVRNQDLLDALTKTPTS